VVSLNKLRPILAVLFDNNIFARMIISKYKEAESQCAAAYFLNYDWGKIKLNAIEKPSIVLPRIRVIGVFIHTRLLSVCFICFLLVLFSPVVFAQENDSNNQNLWKNTQRQVIKAQNISDHNVQAVDSPKVIHKKSPYNGFAVYPSRPKTSSPERREVPSHNNDANHAVQTVPYLIGYSGETAKVMLQRNGLSVGEIRHIVATGNPDIVLEQYPSAGQQVETRVVDLVLSEERKVKVPDLIGITVDSAKVVLQHRGFTLGTIRDVESETGAGLIVSQKPSSGYQLWAVYGSTISIQVSKSVKSVFPNVVGHSAQSAHEKANLPANAVLPDSVKSTKIDSSQHQQVGSSDISPPSNQPDLKPVNPQKRDNLISGLDDKLLLTGGAIIILAGGVLLGSRIHPKSLQSMGGKHANIYAKIDYGKQQVNVASLSTKVLADNRDISICVLPDKGIQEAQVNGSLVQSD